MGQWAADSWVYEIQIFAYGVVMNKYKYHNFRH